MSHPEQESAEVNPAPESENHDANGNEKSVAEENRPTVNEQEPIRRMKMPQDIRYATEQGDRDKLSEKYGHYQVSDVNTCNMRFVIDYRQKKNLLGGRHDDEEPNLHSIGKTFNLHILPAYQSPPKHAFKVFGTEANVRKCLIDLLNRIFKQPSRSTTQNDSEDRQRSTPTVNNEEATKDNQNSSSDPTSIFVTTINPDSSVTEEKKPIIPSTSDSTEVKDENQEQEQYKFVPLERKPEYTFTMLITGQGQEVLKKNWSFFAGSLQQRLNVTVMNPFKLHKFGDNQWQNELAITGELFENIIDAALQLTAFINDVLGVPNQPYKSDDEYLNNESNNYQRSKMNSNNNSNNDYHHSQRRHEYSNNNNNNNGNYRQSAPQQHQGQSSTFNNNHHERTFFNRGRNNGVYEQVILIRGNCVARIVGTRGSNLRRLQTKCHLRDIVVARHPNENGYVDCTLTAYQTRNLAFAVDTIRGFLRNEDDQAIQILEARYIDLPLQSSSYQNSLQHDQPQLSAPSQNGENSEQYTFNNNNRPQQPTMTFPASSESNSTNREPGFMTRPLHFGNGTQLPQPSYNFRNTPSFDFTHQPTSAARKTDKRPGEINDCTSNPSAGQTRTSSDCQTQNNLGSSSSNSSSVSPRHQSKRTCPETKEIDCTTDEGFWIQKQYYHALDDTSKELFDSLLDKLEKIRIANEENAARKQQRLVGRTRANKSRAYQTSMTHTNGEKDLIKQEEKNEELTHSDEQKEEKDVSQTTTPEITNESN